MRAAESMPLATHGWNGRTAIAPMTACAAGRWMIPSARISRAGKETAVSREDSWAGNTLNLPGSRAAHLVTRRPGTRCRCSVNPARKSAARPEEQAPVTG